MSAQTWHDALERAGHLDPVKIEGRIMSEADNGLRAQAFDATGGGRTTRVPCDDPEHCDDGTEPHSHLVTSDPTGNAATSRHRAWEPIELHKLNRAVSQFIHAANGVLWWVCGDTATSWAGVVRINARLLPGTIQAGLDVDEQRHLPRVIDKVDRAVSEVAYIAASHQARNPSQDERHWTDDLADEQVCAWHLELHRRYRRPRVGGTNCCASCLQLAEVLGQKPPRWLLEAEVDLRESRPMAWRAALSRCMDELGVVRSA